ncbi:hypothetical protein RCS94_02360 [Orbaceae bacterium ac157xtp]
MIFAPASYGALSATTTAVIQGNIPVFTGHWASSKLGFNFNNTEYSQANGNIDPTIALSVDKGVKLWDFQVRGLYAGDFNLATDYYDGEGDIAHDVNPFTLGNLTYEWYDGAGNQLDDMSKTIGCSGFNLPLRLNITMHNIQAHSKYGLPRDSAGVTLNKSYLITSNSGLCYLKPGSMHWYDGGGWGSRRNPIVGGGYTDDFDPTFGFKADAGTKFPTIGFPGAKFQLIMTGAPTNYDYSLQSNPNNSAYLDTVNGYVTLVNKPTGNITVRATLKSHPWIHHDYTFNATRLWVWIPNPDGLPGHFEDMKGACGNEANILKRAEFSNSPQSYVNKIKGQENYGTRAIGEGLFAEWGDLDLSNYPGSQWKMYKKPGSHNTWMSIYWAGKEPNNRTYVYSSINGTVGDISPPSIIDYYKIACRG